MVWPHAAPRQHGPVGVGVPDRRHRRGGAAPLGTRRPHHALRRGHPSAFRVEIGPGRPFYTFPLDARAVADRDDCGDHQVDRGHRFPGASSLRRIRRCSSGAALLVAEKHRPNRSRLRRNFPHAIAHHVVFQPVRTQRHIDGGLGAAAVDIDVAIHRNQPQPLPVLVCPCGRPDARNQGNGILRHFLRRCRCVGFGMAADRAPVQTAAKLQRTERSRRFLGVFGCAHAATGRCNDLPVANSVGTDHGGPRHRFHGRNRRAHLGRTVCFLATLGSALMVEPNGGGGPDRGGAGPGPLGLATPQRHQARPGCLGGGRKHCCHGGGFHAAVDPGLVGAAASRKRLRGRQRDRRRSRRSGCCSGGRPLRQRFLATHCSRSRRAAGHWWRVDGNPVT